MNIKALLSGAAIAAVATFAATGSANALVTISSGPVNGSISPFGTPDTQTYGEVFTAPITGTMTSFTLYLDGGVGSLEGAVGTWNGGASFGYGYGSPSTLYVSGATPSLGAGAYTFTPNVPVVAGDQYVAFLSVYGDANTAGQTSMPTAATGPYVDYFVWNNTSSPYGNASWNYFFQTNAEFQASFNAVPEPASWALMLVGFAGLGAVVRSRRTASAVA